jgi:hypothetical protein
MEYSPIVISKFGVNLKVFLKLAETYSEDVIKKAIRLTEKALEKSKIENPAGYFVEALKQNYQEPEEIIKTKEKAKIDKQKTETTVENIEKERLAEQRRMAYEREKQTVMTLIEEDKALVDMALESLKFSMFGSYYNPKVSLLDNLKNKLFESAFINEVKKIKAL